MAVALTLEPIDLRASRVQLRPRGAELARLPDLDPVGALPGVGRVLAASEQHAAEKADSHEAGQPEPEQDGESWALPDRPQMSFSTTSTPSCFTGSRVERSRPPSE